MGICKSYNAKFKLFPEKKALIITILNHRLILPVSMQKVDYWSRQQGGVE